MKKILVQNQDTKCFLAEQGGWTKQADGARHFPTSLNAIVHCLQKNLDRVQVIIRVTGSSSGDIVVPIEEERTRTAQDLMALRHNSL